MATSSQSATSLLPLSDDELYAGDQAVLDRLELALSDSELDGLVLRAPAQVDLATRKTLPVVVGTRKSMLRAWEVTQASNLTLLLTDPDTGQTQAIAPLQSDKALDLGGQIDAPRPPKPTGSSARGTSTKLWWLDARARFGLDWRPRRFALAALSWDWPSNSQLVRLEGTGEAPLAGPTGIVPSPSSGGLPSYRPFRGGPEAPSRGVVFDLQPQPDQGRQVAAGAFTLPARAAHLRLPHADAQSLGVAALVPVTLALVRLDEPYPWLYEWSVPVYGAAPASTGDPLTGYFAIDIAADSRGPLPVGQYVAYLLIEGALIGPRRVHL